MSCVFEANVNSNADELMQIGVWDRENIPSALNYSFNYYDQIWAPDEIVTTALAPKSPIPVVNIQLNEQTTLHKLIKHTITDLTKNEFQRTALKLDELLLPPISPSVDGDHPRVSIIIPFAKNRQTLLKCIDNIKQHTTVQYEVIVVDDMSEQEIDILEDTNVMVIHNTKKLGYGSSVNRGIQVAKGDYIVFLNDDAFLPQKWFENFVGIFDKFSSVGIVGPRFIFPSGGKAQEDGKCCHHAFASNQSININFC